MSYKIQKLTGPLVLGEGPHWDDRSAALYFVDINAPTINKYVLATGTHTKTKVDGRVGFIIPVEGTTDQFLVGLERRFVIIRWDGTDGSDVTEVKLIAEVDKETPTNRINDAKADSRGRVYGGTIGAETGPAQFDMNKASLYRIDKDQVTKLDDGITVSNGLAWDLKEKAFYYTDSMERKVRRYDYDVETGNISNRTYCFDLVKNNITGFPDGSTIDTDGNLWIAVYGGSCVHKLDPRTGKLLEKIPIPAVQITSVTFGGPNLDILFVTSAGKDLTDDEQGGSTFMVTGLGVKGTPNLNYKL